MSKTKIEIFPEQETYKDLLEFSHNRFKENVAYKYKENKEDKNSKIIEKTYDDTYKDVKALATALLKQGFKDKKVAIIGTNRYEWVIGYFAVLCGGMLVAPMDRLLPEVEIASLIKRAEIDAVIFDKSYLEIFKKLKKDTKNNLHTIICMDDIEDSTILKMSDLIESGKKALEDGSDLYDKVEIDRNKTSIFLFTSGTTSQSKIVELSQANILTNIAAYQNHFKMLPTDTLLSILPIHHTFECSITIMYGFFSGATVAFCDGLRHIADNLKEYEVSIFVAVPLLIETMYKKINKGIEAQGKTKLVNKMIKISNFLFRFGIDIRRKIFKSILDQMGGKLRIMLYGAAKLDKEAIIGFNNFGLTSIQGYGLTETSPVVVAESETRHCPGSAGFPLDNEEITILHPDKDGIGEVGVKGPNVFLGYYKDKKKTSEAFENGWFKTGDYGYINKEGFLFITGRKNDIIVLRNGKNIYPDEIEQLINRLPYVKESLVYSREQTKTDTLLEAKIVYDPDEIKKSFDSNDKEELEKLVFEDIKKINKDLPTYKHIKKITLTDEPMEKTTTQKIKRYVEIKKATK